MTTKEQIEWLEARKSLAGIKALKILKKLLAQEEAMTDAEVLAWAKRIHPLLRGDTPEKVGIGPEFLNSSELWWSAPCKVATKSFSYNNKVFGKATGLRKIGSITTYHRYGGFYGFLRPSTDEVIRQCPTDWLPRVTAFELQSRDTNIHAIYRADIDRHVLTTVYYEGAVPQELTEQEPEW